MDCHSLGVNTFLRD